ncbi:MAG: hypothetical protein ACXADW_13595 [Candidatus Hodarchaeales archaeon]|jgi:hypothetical protein
MPNFVDEMCTCGHLKSSHEDSVYGLAKGHDKCKLCDCEKFTWEKFITQDDVRILMGKGRK